MILPMDKLIDCKFTSNTGNKFLLMSYYWSLIEIGGSNDFTNNNNYDTLIQLIDSTINIDNIEFNNNDNINTFIDFGRDSELGINSNAFCVSNLNILSTNSANNEFIHLTNVTNIDSISIINSKISSTDLNAFISGYSSSTQNAATITLQKLQISNFGTTFINLDDIDNKLFILIFQIHRLPQTANSLFM